MTANQNQRLAATTGPGEQPAAATASGRAVSAGEPETARASYILDTSVLLSDPRALLRFAEHEVILPVVVITELEGKRHDPELGYFARKALRLLDDLRVEHGGLNHAIPLGAE
ncbi:MAG TPA: PIN domain-containing protein, partial [Arthrobacter sp.]|nr:PIN domain-containing protein [Arthrobacter sp.]